MKVKRYVGSIPANVSKAMGRFAGGVLASVDRIASDDAMQQSSCHPNVAGWVADNGGKAVTGWLLVKKSTFISRGIWVWVFHSLWMDKKGNLIDITYQGEQHDDEKSIVWLDIFRKPDLNEGLTYNNIMVVDNGACAKQYGELNNMGINPGEIYWASPDMTLLKPIKMHNGIYRWLNLRYSKNIKMFEDIAGCNFHDFLTSKNKEIDKELIFEFSLN
jgi:hypothetical protein